MANSYENCKVLDVSYKLTKTGKNMANISLRDVSSGEVINCTMWQEVIEKTDKKALKPNNIISVIDSQYNEQYKTLTLNKIILVEEAPIGLSQEQTNELYGKIISVVKDFKDKNLEKAVLKILNENEALFKTAPAARTNHHNFVGGLILHVWECINIAKANFPVFFQKVDTETILAACITHDLGKMYEYKIDTKTGLIEYNQEFQKDWISHIQFGFSWAMNNGFKKLARIIAAHHGRTDWGALIDLNQKDLEPMLYLMHHIDDLSAKFGAVNPEDIKTLKII